MNSQPPVDVTSKEYKEWRVSNLDGSGLTEIHLVISTVVLSYWLWKCKTAADYHRDPTRFTESQWSRVLFECAVFFVPMFLTLTDQFVYPTLAVLIGGSVYFRWKIPDPPYRHDKWAPDPRAEAFEKSHILGKVAPKAYLSIYRAEMMLLTCFCILAVDFNVFPLKFAKVETFGTSIMDLGVGSFVFSAGVVGVKPFLPRLVKGKLVTATLAHQLKAGLWTAFPILILGFARLVLTESVDYQKHVSEYGTHWNFFFTLGFLPIFVPLGLHVYSDLRVTSTVLVVAYQAVYSLTPFGDWLENADRTGLVSANREGVFSFIGYLAMFLMGMSLGSEILSDVRTFKERRMRLVSVLGVWTTACISFMLASFVCGIEPSRRFANAPYCFWVAGFNSFTIWLFMLVEEDVDSKLPPQLSRSGRPAGYDVPIILDAVNMNSLTTFLVANLLTGSVNMLIETLLCDSMQAYLILGCYTLLFMLPALLLYRAGLRLR
ncbi:Glucosaminyl phosphatidylinositol (GlcN-PI) nositol acylation protein [Kickxella alabastrina]|uniref:Glucosaminyl phosphatidylinositol (GlcN-PI) nositol acylation protein n=1 Tax=Kickxella alabastrina TaxID=61397 RepID=A0ACC1IH66_9FUNG|nr:Glucosaminyl phosphatidylinositol (GlcN-PI) nositol acylation protein [Kickxella alabastrina]